MQKQQFIFILLLLLTLSMVPTAHSQEYDRKKKEKMWRNKEELEALGLYRFFWEGTAFVHTGYRNVSQNLGPGFKVSKFSDPLIGTAFKVGHNCFIVEKRFTGVLRFTWAQTGLTTYGGIFNPVNIGIGPIIRLNRHANIELTLNGGVICVTDDALDPSLEFFAIYHSDLKVNIRKASIALSYGTGFDRDKEFQFEIDKMFFALCVGMRF